MTPQDAVDTIDLLTHTHYRAVARQDRDRLVQVERETMTLARLADSAREHTLPGSHDWSLLTAVVSCAHALTRTASTHRHLLNVITGEHR